MTNPVTPYGFKYEGLYEGIEPTFGIYTGQISVSNTHSLYQFDPAVFSAGYWDHATVTGTTGAVVNGFFIGFDWLSISAGMRVYNRAWLGQTADLVANSTISCKVAIGVNLIVQARVTGASNNPIVQANVGSYINFAVGAGPGANLVSTYSIDATSLESSSTTLPFQIYKLIQPPYSDPTSANNDILVSLANGSGLL
jgi:hypothetical protein